MEGRPPRPPEQTVAASPPPYRPDAPPADATPPPWRWRFVTLLLGVLSIGLAAAVVVLVAGDDEDEGDAGAPAPAPAAVATGGDMSFSAMAHGVETVTQNARGEGVTQIDIELTFIQSQHGLATGTVRKTVDGTTAPPFRSEGTYTLETEAGDELVLAAEGLAFPPDSNVTPDETFFKGDEVWSVESGTGVFEGATGDGRLYAAGLVAGPEGPNVDAKVFVGELKLAGEAG